MSRLSYRLGDIAPLKYGKSLPARVRLPGEVPVVSSGGITGFHNVPLVNEPCIVVGRKGSIGSVYLLNKPCFPIDTAFYTIGSECVNLKYLFYLLQTCSLSLMNNDSAVPGLNRAQVESLIVKIPSIEEQKVVAATLGALDDKIEANLKLVSIADTLAAEKARLLISSVTTKEYLLEDLVWFNSKKVKPKSMDSISYVDIASVSQGRIDAVKVIGWKEAPSRARRGVDHGDIIFSTVRPKKRSFSLVLEPEKNMVVSTGFAVLKPKTHVGSSMLQYIVEQYDFADYLDGVSTGSAYPAVSVDNMGKYKVFLPESDALLDDFEVTTMPLREIVGQSLRENRKLSALRDALLPELMSGRIRIPEAREAVEQEIK